MVIQGRVVQVRGDYVKVGFRDEDLKHVGMRGQFLKIKTRMGKDLISIIASLELSDELYRQARSLSMFPEAYEELILTKNDVLVNVIGTLEENGRILRKHDAIPSPGDIVEPMSTEELNMIFRRDAPRYIRIGRLVSDTSVGVSLDLNHLATKHVAILAMTGAGKSNTLATLIIRILKRLPSARIVLIDTHSEYIGLAKLNKIVGGKISIYCPMGKYRELIKKEVEDESVLKNLEIPYWFLNADEWFSLLGLGSQATTQRRVLRMKLRQLKGPYLDAPVYFELEGENGLITLIANERSVSKSSIDSLLDKIDDVRYSAEYEFIFNPLESLKARNDPKRVFRMVIEPIISPGLKIFALGGIPSDVQAAVVSMLLRSIFRVSVEAKLIGKIIPTIIAIEEAHLYAPSDHYPPSRGIIERIAKEGRKFGVGLIIVSQRPKELSSTVLAQCGTLIALRLVNSSDQRYIMESIEDITLFLTRSLSGLGVGEALISGLSVPIPCIVKIDSFNDVVREEYGVAVELGGRDIDVTNIWLRDISESDLDEIIDGLYRTYESRSPRTEEKQKPKQLTLF